MNASEKRHGTIKKSKDRKLNRLRGCDYSQPGYFYITVCVKDRIERFGEIKDDKMVLNKYGKAAEHYWMEIPRHYENVRLDRFVIMPNHIHGIIQTVGTGKSSKNVSISQIVKSFKEATTKHIRSKFGISFHWQRSFYDHIVRDQEDLMRIRAYIAENPLNWSQDDENISCR